MSTAPEKSAAGEGTQNRRMRAILKRLVDLSPDNPRFMDVLVEIQDDAAAALHEGRIDRTSLPWMDKARKIAVESRRQASTRFADEVTPLVIREYSDGWSFQQIADQFNAKGIRPAQASHWTSGLVRHLYNKRLPHHEVIATIDPDNAA